MHRQNGFIITFLLLKGKAGSVPAAGCYSCKRVWPCNCDNLVFYRIPMPADLESVYNQLYAYCEGQDFAGPDPFDGLNSSLFQATPLRRLRPARLAWLQLVKRSPSDLRTLLKVPGGVNAKGIALFTLAELSRLRATGDTQHAENAGALAERLLQAQIPEKTSDGKDTAAFGYNFDWQSRNFFAPAGTPAIVPTAFACRAFIEAFEAFRDDRFLKAADSICQFILTGLNRPVDTVDEICFSYTPVDHTMVYNASLLAGESLAGVGALTGNDEYIETAARAARFVIRRQRTDGAWVYGEAATQKWVDNFHTAYILLSLQRISNAVPSIEAEVSDAIRKGLSYWLDNFFLDDGTPKYYDNAVYPIDIHSAAVAIAAMSELQTQDGRMLPMARKTADWTVANMFDPAGFFYYQVRKSRTIKTPFMRWGQAWMAYGLARLIESIKATGAGN